MVVATDAAAYRDQHELVHRRDADASNEMWQADHTVLDALVLDAGKPVRPWLTVVMDDYSRAIAGFFLAIAAPSALKTALALRQAIWRKVDPDWPICGIPERLYVDNGSDFVSENIEQACSAQDPPDPLAAGTSPRPRQDRAVLPHGQRHVPAGHPGSHQGRQAAFRTRH